MTARGKKKTQQLLGNHQRSWIWGRNLVRETLAAQRWPIHELLFANDVDSESLSEIQQLATDSQLKVDFRSRNEIETLCRATDHQGVIARMGPFPYAPIDSLLANIGTGCRFLVLDRIHDSFNLGAMIRSAGAFGFRGVIFGETGQSGITSQAARSSAGVVNRIPIAQVVDLCQTLNALRSQGCETIAAVAHGGVELAQALITSSVALVIGNEATGISDPVLACCTQRVSISLSGSVESLNAAAAAAVLCYEVSRRQTAMRSPE